MRRARYTTLLLAAFAAPYLIAGIFGGGPNAARTLQAGILMLVVAGAWIAWMAWRGKPVDPERDEREQLLLMRSMAFSFYVMIIAVGTYLQWPPTPGGGAVDASLWLSAVLWGSFLVGYIYNQVRN